MRIAALIISLSVLGSMTALAQTSLNTSTFPTASGTTASTFVGIKSTQISGYKLTMQGALKLWGTGNSTNGVNFSPTILFDNRTASTGRKYYLQSTNEGNFRIVDSTAGEVARMFINSSGNVGIATTSPSAVLHSVGSARFDLGSDATGDIFYRNASGLFTRLPIGTNGQVLTITSGLPAWGAAGGGSGITTLNTLIAATQTFATGTGGTDFGISSAGSTHTFNIPTASASARGLLSSADWTTFNSKAPATGGTGYIQNGTAVQASSNFNISGNGTIGANLSMKGTLFTLGSLTQGGQVGMNFLQSFNASGNGWTIGYTSPTTSDFQIFGGESAAFRLSTNSLERFTILAGGNIGINNNNPQAKLDVAGTFKLADGTQGLGKVLTSDGLGNASWQTPAGGGSSQWTTTGSDIYYNTGNVGVGNTAPGVRLQVTQPAINTLAGLFEAGGGGAVLRVGTVPSSGRFVDIGHNGSGLFLSASNAGSGGFAIIGASSFLHLMTDLSNPVKFSTGNTERMIIDGGGKVGIGTSSPAVTLHVAESGAGSANIRASGPSWDNNWAGGIEFTSHNGTSVNAKINASVNGLFFSLGGTEYMRINSSGGVSIGAVTSFPAGYKMAVAGNIIAEKVRVKLQSSGWPDYVFDSKYPLPTLRETEQFIQQHKHLPGVPAAAEIEKEGLDLGDGQAVLLKKIEELTLHLIEMDKRIEKLEAENKYLKKKGDK